MRNSLYFSSLLLLTVSATADDTKPYDMNGGHYDNSGYYHCHVSGCVQAPSRNQYRSRVFNARDMDMFYLQDDWPYFLSPDNTCKTMRTIVLEATSRIPVTYTNPRQCEVREGMWVDEYTGEEFTRAAALEIDHIIHPKYANATNGYQWDYGKRVEFSNDVANLIPVGRETARKKRQRSIGEWRPRDEFICQYAQNWKQVSDKYELDLFARDTSRINTILGDCGVLTEEAVED
jgi:hypothetical protein